MGCAGSKDEAAPAPAKTAKAKKEEPAKAAKAVKETAVDKDKKGAVEKKKETKNDKKSDAVIAAEKDAAEELAKKAAAADSHKGLSSRLGGPANKTKHKVFEEKSVLDKAKGTKMFATDNDSKKSKIYQALNPDKLYFESRREKEETATSEKIVVGVRGGKGSALREQMVMRDEEGNIIEDMEDPAGLAPDSDDEAVEEEDFDPNNLPDFGPLQDEMNKLRAERERQLSIRQDKLAREFSAKKAAEAAVLEKEITDIRKKEQAAEKAKNKNSDSFVEEARQRVARESLGAFDDFHW